MQPSFAGATIPPCAGATIVRCALEIRSVNSRFILFVWVFDRRSEVFLLLTRDLFGGVEFLRSCGYLREKRWFLVELQVCLKVCGVFEFPCGVSHSFPIDR